MEPEQKGGKGLFTSELEDSLRDGRADAAVHSTKDLPGEMAPGLVIAGYLPRADARDVLVLREGVDQPEVIATGSPRRRIQLGRLFPDARFVELRGNVQTRLRKIADGAADATMLAAAGLDRLAIAHWPGLAFLHLSPDRLVPAVGQGAVAVQCREADADRFAPALDVGTGRDIALERALQAALGGGCHTALGAHVAEGRLYFFHERTGTRELALGPADESAPAAWAETILHRLGLR